MPTSTIDSKSFLQAFVVETNKGSLTRPRPPEEAKVVGIAKGAEGNRVGVYAYSERWTGLHAESPIMAGYFKGDVYINGELTVDTGNAHFNNLTIKQNIQVNGDIQLANADVAEDFDIAGVDQAQPGTVMVFGSQGALRSSAKPYDNCVAGVISGAGDYKPGLVLDKQQSSDNRQPVALMGKVFCNVDAQFGAIEVGDLLTTSSTPGHAMKVTDATKAFGTVIGKALRSFASGCGQIPILVSLQ